jgi:MoaA/NifB/PqqE/SkfB family radical SAM enzyme
MSAASTLALAGRLVRLGVARVSAQPLPFSMTFILTHRCNFRCDYCAIPDAAGDEMSAEEFRGAIDELAALGMQRASFSGGEALLRPDALDIIRHARSRGLTTSLNSNAWLALAHIAELADTLDMLVVSLDGPEEVHDLVRRRRGSYERVLEVIDEARRRNLSVATITVLSHANLNVMDDVLALAQEHGFWAYFQPAYEDCFSHAGGLDPALGPRIYADIAARLDRARKDGLPVGASPGYIERLSSGPRFGDCASCHAGRYFGTVMPDGTVVPCHLTSQDHAYPNGRRIGFARAFLELPRPLSGPGCAISPYQESDLIFALDSRAVRAAVRRLSGVPRASSKHAPVSPGLPAR